MTGIIPVANLAKVKVREVTDAEPPPFRVEIREGNPGLDEVDPVDAVDPGQRDRFPIFGRVCKPSRGTFNSHFGRPRRASEFVEKIGGGEPEESEY